MKEYLGDGVYAEVDPYGCLLLTTEDGIRVTNMVVLEPETLFALEQYVVRCRAEAAKAKPLTYVPST